MSWTHEIRLGEIQRAPTKIRLEADAAARKAVARQLGLVSIESLTADLALKAWLDGAELTGAFVAEVTQTCSVSAEDFPERVEGQVFVRMVPAGSPNAPTETIGDEIEVDLEGDDPPDVLESDRIDLAGYVVEHLALELDPFPRKPGAVFEPPPEETPASPFAILRKLKADDSN
ncbi:uncharacterized metal-binding protein YceD (DUF177 family) [Caulobacter ginsengisoli]|uniref:Uncharacterized metal-binding protein YceD (DUF177 family) n=1 Tax=Caulobacter ginsengisoli TaxID=400775 RepID=A0ABU0IQB6_9CAUL|nr:DUF177 domain-containing protein [Caulobacter ginsengisoli]MDQ0463214.1 uncharacterized metal-binding protein YceD (DUF177 family) [Caulobacter ginsengisoli]